MPDAPHNPRGSETERQLAARDHERYIQNRVNADEANARMWHEVYGGWGNQLSSLSHNVRSVVDSGVEFVQDRAAQAGHIIPDTIARAVHDPEVQARSRVLFPEDYRPANPTQHTLAVRTPQQEAPHSDSTRRSVAPTQHSDAGHRPAAPAPHGDASPHNSHPPAAHGAAAHAENHRAADTRAPQDGSYVVRPGDNLSSIVRRDEEQRHPGVHNARQEHLRVQALVDRYGETLLPSMHLDLRERT